jgi:hypothetical protein
MFNIFFKILHLNYILMEKENKKEDDLEIDSEECGLRAVNYSNAVERYFVQYYLDKGTDKEQYVFIHTNGIIMCGLGNNNALLKKKIKEVKDLNKVTKVSGKRKRIIYNYIHFLINRWCTLFK